MSFIDEIKDRGEQRAAYLEDPNYKRLSDVIDKDTQSYGSRTEISMIGKYLGHSDVNECTNKKRLEEIIENNLDNPTINWEGIFNYLDKRLETIQRPTSLMIKDECYKLRNILERYRNYFQSTFVGFVSSP